MAICPTCGKEPTGIEREIRLKFPQPIVDAVGTNPESERVNIAPGEDFIQFDNKHFFVRVLLPVMLDIGHEFRFGVWLAVSEKDAKSLWHTWDTPAYANISIAGHLANLVPPWNAAIYEAACVATVRDTHSVPFITSSPDGALSKVLTVPWSTHEYEAVIESVWNKT